MEGVPTLYLLCGLAFAGKSTLARLLAEATGAAVVSLDEINARRGLYGGAGIPDHEWLRTHEIALGELAELCRAGGPVVIDDTNCFRWLRDAYRRAAAPHGYADVVLFLDLSPEEALQRAAANDRSGERPPVTPDVLQELAAKFEVPGPGERALVLPGTAGPRRWLAEALAFSPHAKLP